MANWSIYKAKESLSQLSQNLILTFHFLMAGEVHQQEVEEIHINFMPH